MSNPFTEDWFKLAKEYEDFVNLAKKAKSKQQLHPLVEKRLSIVLSCLYPNDFAVTEVCGIPGGRHDL